MGTTQQHSNTLTGESADGAWRCDAVGDLSKLQGVPMSGQPQSALTAHRVREREIMRSWQRACMTHGGLLCSCTALLRPQGGVRLSVHKLPLPKSNGRDGSWNFN